MACCFSSFFSLKNSLKLGEDFHPSRLWSESKLDETTFVELEGVMDGSMNDSSFKIVAIA